jgi:peptide/nickel transport system permease protein
MRAAKAIKKRKQRGPVIILLLLMLLGLAASQIATDLPWFIQYKGHSWYPALSAIVDPNRTETIYDPESGIQETLQFDIIEWKELNADQIVYAPIPWSPGKPDMLNRDYTGPLDEQKFKTRSGTITNMPLRFRHWLGTDALGNDLLSGIIHGTGISLMIGLCSMIIAGIIGIFLGSVGGFFGNNRISISRAQWYFTILGAVLGFFWAFVSRFFELSDAISAGYLETIVSVFSSLSIMAGATILFGIMGRMFHFIPFLKKHKPVPLDAMIQRFSEIFNSIPRLIIIVTLAAIFREKSIGMVIAIIGLTSWPAVYRYCRAEMLSIRELSFIEAARAYGLAEWRILIRHALPHSLNPAITELSFLVSAGIITESSLSFLGIGVPEEVVTWGSLLSAGRQQFDAWWMVVFPGIAIFITVLCFNLFGEQLRERRPVA